MARCTPTAQILRRLVGAWKPALSLASSVAPCWRCSGPRDLHSRRASALRCPAPSRHAAAPDTGFERCVVRDSGPPRRPLTALWAYLVERTPKLAWRWLPLLSCNGDGGAPGSGTCLGRRFGVAEHDRGRREPTGERRTRRAQGAPVGLPHSSSVATTSCSEGSRRTCAIPRGVWGHTWRTFVRAYACARHRAATRIGGRAKCARKVKWSRFAQAAPAAQVMPDADVVTELDLLRDVGDIPADVRAGCGALVQEPPRQCTAWPNAQSWRP